MATYRFWLLIVTPNLLKSVRSKISNVRYDEFLFFQDGLFEISARQSVMGSID